MTTREMAAERLHVLLTKVRLDRWPSEEEVRDFVDCVIDVAMAEVCEVLRESSMAVARGDAAKAEAIGDNLGRAAERVLSEQEKGGDDADR